MEDFVGDRGIRLGAVTVKRGATDVDPVLGVAQRVAHGGGVVGVGDVVEVRLGNGPGTVLECGLG